VKVIYESLLWAVVFSTIAGILIYVVMALYGCVYVVNSEGVYINDKAQERTTQQHQQTHTNTNRDRHDTHENQVEIETDFSIPLTR